jgi:hypothetical protein
MKNIKRFLSMGALQYTERRESKSSNPKAIKKVLSGQKDP